jgi:hypothetical protein
MFRWSRTVPWVLACCWAAFVVGGEPAEPDTSWGSVAGRVTLDGDGAAGAVVYLSGKPVRIHPSLADRKLEPREVVCERGLLSPRTMIVEVGQTVSFTARDEAVNFEVQSLLNRPVNRIVKPGKPFAWTPARREPYPVRVGCNFRPSAVGYWLVVDHPYAVLTASDGLFRLENVPAGEQELTIWHETVGAVAKKLPVTVRQGEVVELPPLAIPRRPLTTR